MPTFDYQARNTTGQVVKGQIEALHEQEALDKLWARSLLAFSVKSVAAPKARTVKSKEKVPPKEVALLTRQLGTMLKAGLPITKAVTALARQSKNESTLAVLQDVVETIENGSSFSDALGRHPRVFNKLYVSTVRAGEAGGILPDVLHRVARYLEDSLRLRQKVRSAMAYPTIVCFIAICISLFLVLKIIPIFGDIYKEFKHGLPWPTQMLIRFSEIVRHYLVICVIALAAGGYGVFRLKHTRRGGLMWDHCKLKFPLLGQLALKIAFARFARTCSALLRSGVPILTTLHTIAQSSGNGIVEAAILSIANQVEHGSDLGTAMTREPLFPQMIVEMVAVGEQTGKVAEMLEQAADYYEADVEAALNGLTSMIEPILIVFLGTVVGTIVLCMFLPIFKLSDIVQF